MEDMATRGRDQSADPGPEWRAAQSRPVPLPFWRESGKSREREGSALALSNASFLLGSGGCGGGFRAPAFRSTLEDVTVVKQSVEHRADGGDLGQ